MKKIIYKTSLALFLLLLILILTFLFLKDDIFLVSGSSMKYSVLPGDFVFAQKWNSNDKENLFGKICTVHSNQLEDNKVYLKRCLGLPGDTLLFYNRKVFVNINRNLTPQIKSLLRRSYLIWVDSQNQGKVIHFLKAILKANAEIKVNRQLNCLEVSLSETQFKALENCQYNITYSSLLDYLEKDSTTRVDTFVVPFKGMYVKQASIEFFRKDSNNMIRPLSLDENRVKSTVGHTISKDYYFFVGDNRVESLDSRDWGPISKDLIIKKASLIILSKSKGEIDWKRTFKKL